MGSAVSLSSVG